MKILLCLLSEKHVPNLLSVPHFRPDRLVLVETAAMEQRQAAQNFLKALRLGRLDYASPERHHIEHLAQVDDMDAMLDVLKHAHSRYPDAQWSVNITGGNKLMALAAYEYFKEDRRDNCSGVACLKGEGPSRDDI